MTHNTKKLLLLLTPSWLSGLATFIITLLVIGSAYFETSKDGGAIEDGIAGFQTIFSPLYHQLTDWLAQNSLASNMPLLLFWAAVGAFVYVVAVQIIVAISKTATIEQTLFYTNVRRSNLITSLVVNYAVRLLAVFLWFIYCSVFFKVIVPSVVATAKAAGAAGLVSQAGNLAIAALVFMAALQLHVIFFRLILFRTRIFSNGIVD